MKDRIPCHWKGCREEAINGMRLCEEHLAIVASPRRRLGKLIIEAGAALGYGVAGSALYEAIISHLGTLHFSYTSTDATDDKAAALLIEGATDKSEFFDRVLAGLQSGVFSEGRCVSIRSSFEREIEEWARTSA